MTLNLLRHLAITWRKLGTTSDNIKAITDMSGLLGRKPRRSPPWRVSSVAATIGAMMAEIQGSSLPQAAGPAPTTTKDLKPALKGSQRSGQATAVAQTSGQTSDNGPPAEPPEPALPQNEDAVTIHKTGDKRGLGVFVNRDFPEKHIVLCEIPAITAVSIRVGRHKINTIAEAWLKLSPDKRTELRATFRKLRTISLSPPLSRSDERRLESFINEYAFRDLGGSDRAYIFKLTCHINHACPDCANCAAWVTSDRPHKMSVKLRKPVRTGDELFIHYGKPLGYRCALCPSSRPRRALAVVARVTSKAAALVRRHDGQPL